MLKNIKSVFWILNLLAPIALIVGFVFDHYHNAKQPVEPASRGLDNFFTGLVITAYVILAIIPSAWALLSKPRDWKYAIGCLVPFATIMIVAGSFVSVLIYG